MHSTQNGPRYARDMIVTTQQRSKSASRPLVKWLEEETGTSLPPDRDAWTLAEIQTMAQVVLHSTLCHRKPLSARINDMLILADSVVRSRREHAIWHRQDRKWTRDAENRHADACRIYRSVLELLREAQVAGQRHLGTVSSLLPCHVQ